MKNPSGMCMCGCGQVTPLSPASRRGYRKGDSLLYVKGHSSRKAGPEYVEEDCGYGTLCWVWQRHTHDGYGRKWDGSRVRGAHIIYYECERGPVPAGLQLDHLCRTRACVNPNHLEPVTLAENCRRGAQAKLTHADAAAIRESSEHWLAVAARFEIHPSQVHAIKAGKRWAPDSYTTGEKA